jgi:polyvinyl alcohol dehydrogenase (cytochrome)
MRVGIRMPGLLIVGMAVAGMGFAVAQGGLWKLGGQNVENTRYQAAETKIGVANANTLAVKWALSTEGDVSATPAVDGQAVYFPDWRGYLYAADRNTGQILWKTAIQDYTGVPAQGPPEQGSMPGGVVRATPVVIGDLLIMGDQGGRLAQGAKVFAVNRKTGALVWMTQVQGNGADGSDASFGAQFAMVTQPVIVDANNPNVAYVGTAGWEEAMAALIPGYQCCSFRGTVVALNTQTGAVLWRTYTTPGGYSGAGVWGSSGSLDASRKTLYVTTGNNYSVPAEVGDCIAAAGTDEDEQRACLDPANHVDSILAINIQTGAIRWAMQALPFDTWNVACILPWFGNPCPQPTGPDYDFAQGPTLFTAKVNGKNRQIVGAGQKSGDYWAVDRDTGEVLWKTQVGPGGTLGGLQWGSATDGNRIYVAVNNNDGASWTPVGQSQPTTSGAWGALDPGTGAILWQTPVPVTDPGFGAAAGPLSVANGVVYGCTSLGKFTALNAQTGAVLWTFDSGRNTCASGAAISQGTVFWGTGYNQIKFAAIEPSTVSAFSTK